MKSLQEFKQMHVNDYLINKANKAKMQKEQQERILRTYLVPNEMVVQLINNGHYNYHDAMRISSTPKRYIIFYEGNHMAGNSLGRLHSRFLKLYGNIPFNDIEIVDCFDYREYKLNSST